MKNFKIIALVMILFLVILELLVFNSNGKNKIKKPRVSVSTFALYDIVKHIAPKSIEIVNILPFGVDPHNFEMTPKLMVQLQTSSLVLYSGAGLEPWIEKMTFKNRVINMSEYVRLRVLDSDEFEFHKHHDNQCAHNRLDPHYWLDFQNMQKSVSVVTQELIKLQTKNEKVYNKNMKKYMKMLKLLDENYKKYLSQCNLDTLILNHNSLGYLAHKYDFNVESLSGLSPEAEPVPNDIKRILQEIKKDGVRTIFYENFVNAKVIKTVAKDSGISIDTLDTLGNITADEASANRTYEELMYLNLQKLSKALMCH